MRRTSKKTARIESSRSAFIRPIQKVVLLKGIKIISIDTVCLINTHTCP